MYCNTCHRAVLLPTNCYLKNCKDCRKIATIYRLRTYGCEHGKYRYTCSLCKYKIYKVA